MWALGLFGGTWALLGLFNIDLLVDFVVCETLGYFVVREPLGYFVVCKTFLGYLILIF